MTAVFSLFWMDGSADCADIELTESVTAGLRYDTNARIAPEGQQVEEDFAMVISPHLSIASDHKRIRLTGSYTPTAFFYFKNPDLNHLAHTASAGMNVDISEYTNLNLEDTFGYTKDSLEATITGIQTERASSTSNTITLGLGHAFTRNLAGSLSMSNTVYKAAVNTTRTNSASAGFSYTATERTSLSMSYGLTNINYSEPTTDETNFMIHSLQTGFSYQLSPSTQLGLSGGVVYTPTLETSRTDWIASGTVTKTFERSSLLFGYTRTMSDTTGLTSQLNIHESFSLGSGYKVTETIDISVSGLYSRNYTTPVATIDLTSYSAGVSGSWRPYSWMSVSVGYNHFEQVSDATIGSDFNRESIFLNMTATTSRRF